MFGTAVALTWGNRGGFHTVFATGNESSVERLRDLIWLATNLGPGLRFSAAGCALIAAFVFLFRRGRATLPLRLPSSDSQARAAAHGDVDDWDLNFFVPAMIGLMPVVHFAEGAFAGLVYFLRDRGTPSLAPGSLWDALWTIVDASFFAAFVYLCLGKLRDDVVVESVRWPRLSYVGLAVLFPFLVTQLRPFAKYLLDRIAWGQVLWDTLPPPEFLRYFSLPGAFLLLRLLPAFVEEVAWRGYLQPRFVGRYGIWRGIFLIGIVWGAFHFSWDFNRAAMTDLHVYETMAGRLAGTVAMGFVLSWLTLRSGSILPATIAHGFYNMLLETPQRLPFSSWLTVGLWALLAYILFRKWPPVAATLANPDAPA